jgi:hypothetical protein
VDLNNALHESESHPGAFRAGVKFIKQTKYSFMEFGTDSYSIVVNE